MDNIFRAMQWLSLEYEIQDPARRMQSRNNRLADETKHSLYTYYVFVTLFKHAALPI